MVPPPVASDLTGRSISVKDVCTNKDKYSVNGWTVSCNEGNTKALFTYSPSGSQGVQTGWIYPQACLDADSVAATPDGTFNVSDTDNPPPMNVQLSYCNAGDGAKC